MWLDTHPWHSRSNTDGRIADRREPVETTQPLSDLRDDTETHETLGLACSDAQIHGHSRAIEAVSLESSRIAGIRDAVGVRPSIWYRGSPGVQLRGSLVVRIRAGP